jgi:hypothetical protein
MFRVRRPLILLAVRAGGEGAVSSGPCQAKGLKAREMRVSFCCELHLVESIKDYSTRCKRCIKKNGGRV